MKVTFEFIDEFFLSAQKLVSSLNMPVITQSFHFHSQVDFN
jgi:hypothetical protein